MHGLIPKAIFAADIAPSLSPSTSAPTASEASNILNLMVSSVMPFVFSMFVNY